MRRATFVLALVLTAAVIAGAFLYPSSRLPSREAEQPRQTLSANTEALESGPPANETTVVQNDQRAQNEEPGSARKRAPVDEATLRARIRQNAIEEVRDSYSLLLEDLPLPEQEKADLAALLIEMRIEGTWSGPIRGRTIPDQERYERIAAVIGDQKLLEFIALEQNVQAYWETTQIARLLRRKDVPLTEAQRDGVFEILVEVRARYPRTSPPAEIDDDSVEYIDHLLAQFDEQDRHVIELAPSVLSPNQVVRLFDQYQSMSRQRVDSVERHKRLKNEYPGRFRGWAYSPGSWDY